MVHSVHFLLLMTPQMQQLLRKIQTYFTGRTGTVMEHIMRKGNAVINSK